MPKLVVLGLFLFGMATPVVAQNQLSYVSNYGKPNQPVTTECRQMGQVFTHFASLYPHPKSGWSFVIVCDENTWKAFMQKTDFVGGQVDHYGETDIDAGLTLIRGYKLLYPDIGVTAEHVVAHELAHVTLHSRDEYLVDATAMQWIKQQEAKSGQ